MPKETLTPRERWLAVLNRETHDRIPMDYWATPEATEKLLRHMNCSFDEMLERLHIDLPIIAEGRYVGPPLGANETLFGLQTRVADYGTGTYVEFANAPLAKYNSVEEIEADYQWPSPDWWDYSLICPGEYIRLVCPPKSSATKVIITLLGIVSKIRKVF